ncbi:Sip1-related alpha-galactosidase [Gracilibacillus kekensis]|nr:Sip1-related alpha-galactosidase [Gracilibacillus kekensis]
MQEIAPYILLDDGQEIQGYLKNLECKKEEKDFEEFYAYKILFSTYDENIHLTLDMNVYGDKLFTIVSGTLPINSFENTKTFRSESSIELRIKSLNVNGGFLGNYLFSKWWTRPQFGKNISELKPQTQSLIWKENDLYYHLLPLSDDNFKTMLRGNDDGLVISISPHSSGFTTISSKAFILGNSRDPFELTKVTTDTGFDVLNSGGVPGNQRKYPEIFEYLGWCTWDAFYHNVNSEKILNKAKEFKEKNLPVKWLMIDDGWSETKDEKLLSLKEDKTKFPEGLKGTINLLKNNFGFSMVGVWHAYTGYWQGIHPESILLNTLKDSLYKTASGRIFPSPDGHKGFLFWNEWHNYLKKQGVDFVKVDNQSALIDFVKFQIPIGKAAKNSHASLEASVGLHFNSTIINCMGMSAEQLWHRPMTALSRNSDDFYPNKEQNFKEHALQNAYNSFYHRNFIWGDWDMWWTKHEDALNNGILRAVSGGPLYMSDRLGETEPEQLWPLILSNGIVLRCDQGGVPTEDCLLKNPHEDSIPLKVWNTSGNSAVIAAFNINLKGQEVECEIGSKDIPTLEGNRFILYDHLEKKTYLLDQHSTFSFSLRDNEVKLFILVPIENEFASVGLLNKYISPATLKNQFDYGEKKIIILKGGDGVYGFYSTTKPKEVLADGKSVPISQQEALYTVKIEPSESEVLLEILLD